VVIVLKHRYSRFRAFCEAFDVVLYHLYPPYQKMSSGLP
jgi:hypothetical protein